MDDARVRAIVQEMLNDPASLGAAQRFPSSGLRSGSSPVWDAKAKVWKATATQKTVFGVALLTWAGAVFNSNILTVNHNLGAVPSVVVATAVGGGTPAHFFCNVRNLTLTSFDLQGNVAQPDAAPAASTQNALWIAMG